MSSNETPRIHGWITDFGMEYAVKRAKNAMVFYRRLCLNKTDVSKNRQSLIMSYLEFKKFLRTREINYEPKISEAYKQLLEAGIGDRQKASSLQATKKESKESN